MIEWQTRLLVSAFIELSIAWGVEAILQGIIKNIVCIKINAPFCHRAFAYAPLSPWDSLFPLTSTPSDCMQNHFSHIWLFATLWTIALQAPLSMRFSRQEFWNGCPCPSPGDLPNPGIEPMSLVSPALAGGFFTTSTTWEALQIKFNYFPRLDQISALYAFITFCTSSKLVTQL